MPARVLKVNELIKRELSQILLKEADLQKGVLLTVTRVETSPNLIQSKVYLSILPGAQSAKVVRALSSQIYFLQQKLNQRLKMRPTPKIILLEEKETEKAGKIEEVLEKLKEE